MAVNIHITIIELNALHTKRQNLFQELDAVIHLLMEAKHWGLRKSRNATSINSRFKSLDTLKVKIISVTFRRVIRTNHKNASNSLHDALPLYLRIDAQDRYQPAIRFSPANAMDHGIRRASPRSEEHTSELQSRFDLVCRLLLEKKKPRYDQTQNNHRDIQTSNKNEP